MVNLISIFIGGGLGALLRYSVTIICRNIFLLPFMGTLIVNLIGCFLIGCLFGFLINKPNIIPITLRLFLSVGFLGGLTTFSTLNFEVFELIKDGKILVGGLYFIGSCLAGLILTFAGYCLTCK